MVVLTAHYHTHPQDTENILNDLTEMRQLVLTNEPQCLEYRIHRSQEHPDELLIYEAYQDDSALNAHSSTAYFKDIIVGRIIPRLIRRERRLWHLTIE